MSNVQDTKRGLPTEEDVAFYREHGYWISPPLVPAAILEEAARGMERVYAWDVDHRLTSWTGDPLPDSFWGWRPASGDVIRKNDYTSLLVDELARLVHYQPIAACAARLAGVDVIRLWHDQLLYKPVEQDGTRANVGWHVDRQYWMTCSSDNMLTAWVAFHDLDDSAGPISFVDRSNHWVSEGLDFWNQDLQELETRFTPGGDPVRKVVPELRTGQVTFHHCKTIHGSGPNHSARPRRSLAIHLQPEDNRYVERGAHHPNDQLVRRGADGLPDYTDPAICPRLYPG